MYFSFRISLGGLKPSVILFQQDADVIVGDGSVDIKGRPAPKHTTGNWRACFSILGNLFSDTHTIKLQLYSFCEGSFFFCLESNNNLQCRGIFLFCYPNCSFFPMHYCVTTISTIRRCMACTTQAVLKMMLNMPHLPSIWSSKFGQLIIMVLRQFHKPKIRHKLFQAPVSNQARSGGICTLFILCGHLSKHLHCRFLYGMFVSCDFKSSNQPEHLEAFGINHLNKPKYYHILQIEVKDVRLFISSAMRFVEFQHLTFLTGNEASRVSAFYLFDRQ